MPVRIVLGEESTFEIRNLREADLPEALQLAAAAGWNQTEEDWKRILGLSPEGCFGAFAGARLVGTITTMTYGREAAWIGMMLVKEEYRRRGIGKRLMQASLEFCAARGIDTIKLDATPAGLPLYESFGFIPEADIQRWEGTSRPTRKAETGGAALSRSFEESLFELDRRAFGADRRAFLKLLIADACCEPVVLSDLSPISKAPAGYALARRGARALYAGPIVAVDPRAAGILLDGLLTRMPEGKVYLDLAGNSGVGGDVLEDRGFTRQRDLTRMFRGRPRKVGTSSMIFAIAGPEAG